MKVDKNQIKILSVEADCRNGFSNCSKFIIGPLRQGIRNDIHEIRSIVDLIIEFSKFF